MLRKQKRFYGVARLLTGTEKEFPFFLALSLFVHFIIGVVLLSTVNHNRYAVIGSVWPEESVIGRLADDYYRNVGLKEQPISDVTPEQVSAMLKKIYDRLDFAHDLTEKERAEIFEKMLETKNASEAFSIFGSASDEETDGLIDERLQNIDLQLSSRDPIEFIKQGPSGKYSVHRVNAKSATLINKAEKETNAGTAMTISGGDTVLVPSGNGPKEVPVEYYFRTSPYQKMAAVRGGLFTIVREHDHAIDLTRAQRSAEGQASKERTAEKSAGGERISFVFLASQRANTAAASAERRPLTLSESQIGLILDELMSLEVEEQITVFKKEYLDRYDWELGDLALLTREFIFNNLNGVFFVLDDLTGAFDQAEELFFKRPVYDFFAGEAGRFPRTRTDSEICFYLASAQDFELRTIRRVFAVKSDINAVINGDKKSASMFQPITKALVLRQICDDLLQSAAELRISPSMMMDWYLDREQEILSELTENGCETRNRALGTWGKLLWREENYDRAIAKWKMVDRSTPISSRALDHIINIIDRYGFNSKVQRAIDEKLNTEDVVGREDRLNRHLKFHTWYKRSGVLKR